MKILIKNGRVIDPARNFDEICDVALAAGRVVSIRHVPDGFAPARVIDARGCIVAPGLVDLAARLRALQYASTFGYTVWLRPQELHLGKGVAASGPLATRLGLAGVPVAAETIALHTIFDLMRATGARVHLCRLSSAEGVQLVRQA